VGVKTYLPDIIKKAFLTDEKIKIGAKSPNEKISYEDSVKNSKLEADRLLAEAQKKVDDMIKEAEKRSKDIEEKAKKAGYLKGVESSQKDWNVRLETLDALTASLKHHLDLSIEDLSVPFLALSISMMKEIIFSEIDEVSISNKINRALEMVNASKKIVIHLSKDVPEEVIDRIKAHEGIQIITEQNYGKGDLKVEADFGTLDLRLEAQINLFEELIKKSFGSK
jgi:flagellar assembly protein FliH